MKNLALFKARFPDAEEERCGADVAFGCLDIRMGVGGAGGVEGIIAEEEHPVQGGDTHTVPLSAGNRERRFPGGPAVQLQRCCAARI